MTGPLSKAYVMAAVLLVMPASAWAEQRIKIQINNDSDMKRSVELRDLVCDETVVFRARMEPGEVKKARICAGEDGLGNVAAVVATGCASAKVNLHEGLKNGDTLIP